MSTNFKHYKSGDIFGIIYRFDKAGEGIRAHSHQRDHYHNTTVLSGSILVYGPNCGARLRAGDIYDFDSSTSHEIAALEDGTIIINTFLHGQPYWYRTLPASELEGVLELPLTHTISDFTNPTPKLASRA